MVTITLNGQAVEVAEGSTLLEAATAAGVNIPTLCYLKDLNCIGSCRVCLVEVEGQGLVAACNTAAAEGMVVRTDTPQVAAARRANLQAIMDDHRALCATCVRQDTCALRFLSSTFNLQDAGEALPVPEPWDATFPLQRDSSKCIKCMRCVAICDKVQHCGVWDFTGAGPSMKVIVRDNLPIADAGCALCGQCITHCPTGALTARDDVSRIMDAILDPTVETVVQVAPAVRAAWGEGVGLSRDEATPGRLAAALHAVGFDRVFDTDFAADLTIMEEGSEFVEFLGSDAPRPMFTSCCPGWVRFVKQHYPQFTAQLSSAKSPHQMMGAVVKNTLAAEADEAGRRLFVVSIMPCVAKKYECDVPELSTVVGATHGNGTSDAGLAPDAPAAPELAAEATPDVDAVLTVREFGRLLRLVGVDCAALPRRPSTAPSVCPPARLPSSAAPAASWRRPCARRPTSSSARTPTSAPATPRPPRRRRPGCPASLPSATPRCASPWPAAWRTRRSFWTRWSLARPPSISWKLWHAPAAAWAAVASPSGSTANWPRRGPGC